MRLQLRHPIFDSGLFLRTAIVAGVDRYHHHAARSKQIQCLLQRDDGCRWAGNDAAVAAGTVTEIEQHNLHRPGNMPCQLFMAHLQECHPVR